MSSIHSQTSAPVSGNLAACPPAPSFSIAALIFIGLLGFVLIPAPYLQVFFADSPGGNRIDILGLEVSSPTFIMLTCWLLMGTVTRLRQARFWLQSLPLILALAWLSSSNSGNPMLAPISSGWSAILLMMAALFCALPWLQRPLMGPEMRRNRDALSLLFWQNLLMVILVLLAILLPALVGWLVSEWLSTRGASPTNPYRQLSSILRSAALAVPVAALCLSIGIGAIRRRRPFPRAIESCVLRLAHELLPVVAAATLLMAAILVLLPLASLIGQTPLSACGQPHAATLQLMPLLACVLGTLLVLLINASWWRARQATAWQDSAPPLAPPHAGVALRLVERSLLVLPVLAAFSLYDWWQMNMTPNCTHHMLMRSSYLWIPFFVLPPLLVIHAIGYAHALLRPRPDGWLAGIRPVNTVASCMAITLLVLLNTPQLYKLLDLLYKLVYGG